MSWDVVVIGAGAAGMLAASRAAERGRRVLLLEKNRKPGVKILMSGGTRCNLTHAVDAQAIIAAFGRQGRFLHSALAALGPAELVALIERQGVKTKVEAGGKVFPASDKASDILAALVRLMRSVGVTMATAEAVTDLERADRHFLIRTTARQLQAPQVILTPGGQSYPRCGTKGDGYVWARRLGHSLVNPRPALVPVTTNADWGKALRGITIPNVLVRLRARGAHGSTPRDLAVGQGSFLFAHFGVTGPVILNLSRIVTSHPRPRTLELVCDFLPDLSARELDSWLSEAAATGGKRQVTAVLASRLSRRLCDTLAALADLPPDRRTAELKRTERAALVQAVKATCIPLTGTLGFEKAEVTAGGVTLDEVDAHSLQSRLVPGLFLAGEILDLDGPIGGYNFQSAFSTGWLAGENVM